MSTKKVEFPYFSSDRHPSIAQQAIKERIYKDKKFSDHVPLIIDYDYEL